MKEIFFDILWKVNFESFYCAIFKKISFIYKD